MVAVCLCDEYEKNLDRSLVSNQGATQVKNILPVDVRPP